MWGCAVLAGVGRSIGAVVPKLSPLGLTKLLCHVKATLSAHCVAPAPSIKTEGVIMTDETTAHDHESEPTPVPTTQDTVAAFMEAMNIEARDALPREAPVTMDDAGNRLMKENPRINWHHQTARAHVAAATMQLQQAQGAQAALDSFAGMYNTLGTLSKRGYVADETTGRCQMRLLDALGEFMDKLDDEYAAQGKSRSPESGE